ncbi:nucleotidyl transferase AbiEii/AbiGii toxin family protein [uncultured Meiothermus sp.]|jgi:predicted nucleotidyltransferase component of viral defense system|uniref:nucleotidyl transferase AbiEii/AbiGii toxin family protein n=1 Tax=uncultured Meiothermus sp. TaxID=157471 RepID=UPI00260C5E86|nr:nucleotidyl transferase AbiEii/AbiGii toxin family protein [uncultured Meiothermus sp.]
MRNLAASVRARLLNLAKAQGEEFHRVTVRFALERLLYRLGISPHRERFVLKGAVLLLALGQTLRPTKDLDLLGFGSDDAEELTAVFGEIMTLEGEDGIRFDPDSLRATAIREDLEYGGVRLQFLAHLDTARIPVQVDIGFGDAVTPAPVDQTVPTLLGLPAPLVRAYPLETVVAEKFEAMVKLGLLNTRMKDFHDLWSIAGQFSFEAAVLQRALAQTFERRRTDLPQQTPTAFSAEFAQDAARQQVWSAFLGRAGLQTVGLEEVINGLEGFLEPLWLGTARGRWNPQSWKWET